MTAAHATQAITMPKETPTLAVIGAGPAGLAAAAELAERGVSVTVVDPRPDRGWPARYGLWRSQTEALGLSDYVHRSWNRPQITTPDGTRLIDVPYVLMDNESLRQHLLMRIQDLVVAVVFAALLGFGAGPGHAQTWPTYEFQLVAVDETTIAYFQRPGTERMVFTRLSKGLDSYRLELTAVDAENGVKRTGAVELDKRLTADLDERLQ